MDDGSRRKPSVTVGIDLGDKYSHLCLIDTESGEVIEESRLRTTPEALRRRFSSEQPLRVAIEAGTHSPWVSRVLEECDHEVLVDALRIWLAWHVWIRSCSTPSSTEVNTPRLI
jgi:transposase